MIGKDYIVAGERDFEDMLARALTPPSTPAALQACVMAAIARDAAPDMDQLRMALRDEKIRAVGTLRQRARRQLAESILLTACLFGPLRVGVRALTDDHGDGSAMLLSGAVFAVVAGGLLLNWRYAAAAPLRSAG